MTENEAAAKTLSGPVGETLTLDAVAISRRIRRGAVVSRALRTLRLLLLIELALFSTGRVLAVFSDARQKKPIAKVIAFEQAVDGPPIEWFRRAAPIKVEGKDVSGCMVFALLLALTALLDSFIAKLRENAVYLRRRRLEAEMAGADLWSLQGCLAALARGENLDRKKILEIYGKSKRALENQQRPLAFLSIDIVDSTGMKVGEDPAAVECDMMLYRKLVEDILAAGGALKSAWTPDGAMICFPGPENAVKAAQKLVADLRKFNASVKTIRRDFKVRIGVNAGLVSYDDSTPMDQMASRVIDVAGHLQKNCGINSVWTTKEVAELLRGAYALKATEHVVDGHAVFEWSETAS
ncbi:MAG TPA: hypothetical protein VH309_09215 [Elusimicrobiota bacterium]|nr:hypothetical protein [Elusimicrobiota bacterium]